MAELTHSIDNPNILIKDSRILELDAIVTDVRQSEEWEDARMNILEVGIMKGREEGMQSGKRRSGNPYEK